MENKNKNVSFDNETAILDSFTELLKDVNLEYDAISTSATETTIMATVAGSQQGKIVGIIAHLSPDNKSIEDIYNGTCNAIRTIANLKNTSSFPGTIKLMISIAQDASLVKVGIEELAFIGYTADLDAVLVIKPKDKNVENDLLSLDFMTEGLSVHGSAPQIGVNAIDHMRIFLKRFEEFLATIEKEHENSCHVLENLGGGSAPNTIPDNCVAKVNIYTDPFLYQEIMDGIKVIKLQLESELRRFRLTYNESVDIQDEIGDWSRELPVILLTSGELTDSTIKKFLVIGN